MIRLLADIEKMRTARPRRLQYIGGDLPPPIRQWTAQITTSCPMYTKICTQWYGTINLYRWRQFGENASSASPRYMPLMKKDFTLPVSSDGFRWVPDTADVGGAPQDGLGWTPQQDWWFDPGGLGSRVTGMFAINAAEYQYRGDFNRQSAGANNTRVPYATPVGMWMGLFRDFDQCPYEPRISYVCPMFHHYVSPGYQECQ